MWQAAETCTDSDFDLNHDQQAHVLVYIQPEWTFVGKTSRFAASDRGIAESPNISRLHFTDHVLLLVAPDNTDKLSHTCEHVNNQPERESCRNRPD